MGPLGVCRPRELLGAGGQRRFADDGERPESCSEPLTNRLAGAPATRATPARSQSVKGGRVVALEEGRNPDDWKDKPAKLGHHRSHPAIEFDIRLMISTPTIMTAMPVIAAKSNGWRNTSQPLRAVRIIPIPHQMAYAMPSGMVRKVCERKNRAAAKQTAIRAVGNSFEKPADAFRADVPITSKAIAANR